MEMIVQPVVSLVVERVGEWLVGRANLSTQVRSEVEGIQRNLRWMTIILRNSSAKHKQTGAWHNFVVEIEDIAYDAEDVIETFILTVPMRDRRRRGIIHFFLKKGACIYKESVEHHNVVSEIKDVRIRISELFTILQAYGMIRPMVEGEESSSSAQERARLIRRTYSHVVEEDFIDMENDVKKLVGHLVNEDTDNYQTVCICGMGGLGKTTLAQKVYNHKDVKRHFDYLVWACISQQPQKQDVLQGILIKLEKKEKEIRHMRDEELTRLLRQVQLDKRCLIVLDDIWEQGDWDILKFAFPIGEATRSKLLLTTRNKQLASYVNPRGFLHEPRLLNEGEAWELLQKKAFRRAHGSSDNKPDERIEKLGIDMVRHCGGLPLAVVVLGGILVSKHTEEEWEKVHKNINPHISKGTSVGQEDGGVSQVLALSYDDLPYQLKRCFLYLGSFPEDSRIELEKLYELWIAEDLILSGDIEGEDTMMDVAERYLSELAQRYMVHLGVKEAIDIFGNYESLKYCRLHDMMRELSKSRSKGEIFFNVIDSEKISSSSSSNAKVRRVAIHGHLGKEEDYGDWLSTQYNLRSVLLFRDNALIPIINSRHWKDLKVLRVVHLEVRELGKLPKAIGKLIHLRYLSLKGCKRNVSLPSSIGNLRCLQTLDLSGNYDTMRIPNVLWKIKSLTHLYLCERIIIRKGKKMRLSGLGKLEILENFDSSTCDVKDLSNLKNLRKLIACIWNEEDVVVADFVNYLSSPSRLRHSSIVMKYDFKSEEELIVLVKCRHLNTLRLHGVIGGGKLPAVHHFSPSLTALSLSNSKLKEDPMLTLGKLPNLTHLSLSLYAFEGVEMVCSEEGFPQLKFLLLGLLSYLEEWRVDEGAMPNLFKLVIIECRRLKKVPDGLKFISTLQELNTIRMPHEFVSRLGGVDGEE